MAKAQFHKHQRVFVRPVGTWAHIAAVNPKWVQDVDEPVRIYYDVGMGRDFSADELDLAGAADAVAGASLEGDWRIVRGQNKWRSAEECAHHPYPGTHPVVVTSEREWGGWRVPGAEYDRDPYRMERQARIIVNAPNLLALLNNFVDLADDMNDELPAGLLNIADQARAIIDDMENI